MEKGQEVFDLEWLLTATERRLLGARLTEHRARALVRDRTDRSGGSHGGTEAGRVVWVKIFEASRFLCAPRAFVRDRTHCS
jgi:hypothetical protein